MSLRSPLWIHSFVSFKLALKRKLDKSGDLLIYWELFWRLEESTRFFTDLFGFFKLTMVVAKKRKNWIGLYIFILTYSQI